MTEKKSGFKPQSRQKVIISDISSILLIFRVKARVKGKTHNGS